MKKLLTLALAVFAVAAAQAVTINWTLSLSGPENPDNYSVGPGWCGLVMTTETITDKASFKKLISYDGKNATSYTVVDDATTTTTAIKVSGDATYANLGQSATGSVSLSFKTDVTTDTVTFALFNIWNVDQRTGGVAFLTVSGIDTTADSLTIDLTDTTLTWAEKIVNSDTVPEPTALALLALGVAGLALKRKHA